MGGNDNVLDAKKIVLTEKEFYGKATPDEMMIFIEEHYKPRKHFNEGSHYCKCIKIHSVDGFTREEINKLYNERILTDVWDLVIIPYIREWEKDYKYDGKIYTKGRSGGWLYNDKAITLDLDDFEEKREDEDEDEYQDRLYPLRNLFEILWKMQKWYDMVFKEVKEFLLDVELEEEVDADG
jgi:hypothetical protein